MVNGAIIVAICNYIIMLMLLKNENYIMFNLDWINMTICQKIMNYLHFP